MDTPAYHIPALLRETIDGLEIKSDGVYVDCTFGGGGHAREILNQLGEHGKLFGFDQDMDAYRNAVEDKRFTFVHGNFKYLKNYLHFHGVDKVDGVLADLGVSFHHFDAQDRGFSFRFDGKLDMRMNQNASLTAAKILNTYTEEQLADVFYLYGELRNARQIARAIVKYRANSQLDDTSSFVEMLNPIFFKEKEKKDLTLVFQALRIEVNNEMNALKSLLRHSVEVLKPDGRLAIITYHSLEDRLVKNFIKAGNFEGKLEKDFYGNIIAPMKAINNKVIIPSDEEIAHNPRSRSAKLRIARLS